ncbi:MAG: NYN domain-containing protein, partial [Alphaproteobacteria bacterium]
MRVAAYIDGFNLYHAIEAIGDPLLKWTDLRALAGSYLRDGESLERVAFYTAYNTWDAGKRARHLGYVKALQHNGVDVVLSQFAKIRKSCAATGRTCDFREEKRTDVAIATDMLSDCYERGIGRLLLFTADSDQIPAVEHIKKRNIRLWGCASVT